MLNPVRYSQITQIPQITASPSMYLRKAGTSAGRTALATTTKNDR